ncbi:outer membrane protein assembly factor BamA [Plastorhodobacter daqingensis]|uniref:Outer membrane protein assembly factor BamA n=1 Tax=Plastorhodobacter daqingensis TaxID=1387281 RepID=A0ABW2UGJ9_9RHOB
MKTGGTGGRARLGRVSHIALAVLLAAAVPAGQFVSPAFAQSFRFDSVVVEGNQRIGAGTILSYAGIDQGAALSAGELNAALQRIQNSGLFEMVDIEPQGNRLVIRVQEYPTVNVISFEGNRRINDERLGAVVQTQSRRVYSPAQAEADAAAITELYAQSGRLAATVEPRIIRRSENRVDLVFEIREGNVVEIERIAFVGNRAFSDRRLRGVLETKEAGLLRRFVQRDTFIAERIDLDRQLLRDFYQSRGYIDFQVLSATPELARERDGFFVTFTVQEGLQYRIGQISTVSEVPEVNAADYEAVLRMRPGTVYSPALIENNIARMENLALRQGLNFVRIDPRITRNPQTQTLDVQFALVRGPRIFVERIDIEGNSRTLDQVIRRQFRTVEGDPFNPREIREAAERIRALGFFADAQVNARQGTAQDQVIVDVDVEEQPTGSLSFGVSYGVAQGVGFAASLSEQNFLGRGQYVDLTVNTTSSNRSFSFNFREPAFLDRDLALKFNVYSTRTDRDYASYNTRLTGFSPALEFPVSELGRLELRYKISRDDLRDVDPAVSSPILAAEQGALISSGVGYTYSFDTARSRIDPNTRYTFRVGQDFAGLGGDVESVTSTALARVERRVFNEDVLLRAELEGGLLTMISGESRVLNRFNLGSRMRGFEPNGIGPRDLAAPDEDALGGNAFAIARFEAEFPIGLPEEYGVSGGVFMDVGSLWGLDETTGFSGQEVDDGIHLRAAAGFSIFWTTPIGPLRFNFSQPIRKLDYDREQNFDLTVSTRF